MDKHASRVRPADSPHRPAVDGGQALGLDPAATVEAEDLATGARLTYRLVDPLHAAPSEGLLSVASPVGMLLRARRAGEVVTATTARGHRRLRIIAVR